MYKCSCGYETEKGRVFSAHFKHHKGDEHKRLGWVDPATGVIYPTRPTARKATKTPKAPAAAPPPVPQGTVPATALSSARPPVLFDFGQEKIALNLGVLYEAYLLYNDMKARGIAGEDEFSVTLMDGIVLLWTLSVGQPGIEGGKVKLTEVNYGARPGNGEKEAGVELATG